MALEIKSIPPLTGNAALDFVKKADGWLEPRQIFDFNEQVKTMNHILQKSKLKSNNKDTMKQIFESWGVWASNQFPDQKTVGKINHLQKEVQELKESVESGKIDIEEIADCMGLLFSICDKENISYKLVKEVLKRKLSINKRREWGDQNTDGSYPHLEKNPSRPDPSVTLDNPTFEYDPRVYNSLT